MTEALDLQPATDKMKAVLSGITEEQLANATPCEGSDVAHMLDHVEGLCLAFRDAALKEIPEGGSQPPMPSADNLGSDWRLTIPNKLDALADAWRQPGAWEGMTEAGGVTFPAEIMGMVALDELVMHGWDLARATGQDFVIDEVSAQAVLQFCAASAEPGQEASRNGIFGPVVEVPDDAPTFERALGYAGRNPSWAP